MSLLLLFGGVATVTGTSAVTLGSVTSAADGASGASGTLAKTFADATSTASGSTVTGTVARTLADATSAATGASGAAGTTAVTLADATSAAAGTAAAPTVSGTLAVTLDNVTSAAAGSSVTATLTQTLGNATSAAAGGSGAAGTVAVTLGDTTCAATGSEVTGDTAVSLADITSAADGAQGGGGNLDVTLADITSAATGGGVAGTLEATLEVTAAAVGTFTEQVTDDPFPVKCTIRRQQFGRKFRYHRHAERPAIAAWAFDARDALIDFSDASYEFTFRIGNPGADALLEKTNNIVGAVGTGETTSGTPNVTINWEPGELDIEPGTYACQLIATITSPDPPGPDILPPPPLGGGGTSNTIDIVYHGQIQILDLIY